RPTSCACRCRGTALASRTSPSEWLRVLGAVRMLRACVDLQLRDLLAAELVARKHALDRLPQQFGRDALELFAQRTRPQAAWVTGVAVVHLLLELVPRHRDLLRVHDD